MTDQNHFADHEIVDRVESERLCSWLMRSPAARGMWVRITAADGLLTVVGDFEPTIFAYGPSDPIACVRWLGSHQGVDHYVREKAIIGSGRAAVLEHSEGAAREDIKRLLAEAERDDYGDEWKAALRAGLEAPVNFFGVLGVHEIRMAVIDECDLSGDAWELLGNLGERVGQHVHFAIQALNRLVQLLDAEKAAAA